MALWETLLSSDSKKQAKKWRRGARQIADITNKVLEPVLARRTGMTMELLTAWPELAGSRYADVTLPEKLDWPKNHSHEDAFEPACLVIACEGTMALFLQHESGQLIERVNSFFGYPAINRIRIIQKPIVQSTKKRKRELPPLSKNDQVKLDEILDGIEDEKLKASLRKLGTGIFSKGSSKN
jgi:hypothetical protein